MSVASVASGGPVSPPMVKQNRKNAAYSIGVVHEMLAL
jgi:hypothetical protein